MLSRIRYSGQLLRSLASVPNVRVQLEIRSKGCNQTDASIADWKAGYLCALSVGVSGQSGFAPVVAYGAQ